MDYVYFQTSDMDVLQLIWLPHSNHTPAKPADSTISNEQSVQEFKLSDKD